ncbi:cupin domain-containing protein [Parachitinimonas caeni]|uniref:Cupin domain-containing protein n=1 Tax=Parachitinimonas caeni TaxID=3031301 RepID=A0ABT7E013_9NEIS|nr:cupin domain-containing protein [Parachitinimonas caeni]MDK2125656.1 cupin domain-containing protein [Parachitinimonas caeni]
MTICTLLGGISAEQFLAEYWQKKPLLIRQAVKEIRQPLDLEQLCRLACRDDVESRLVEFNHGRWKLEHGPFRPARFKRLGESDWTILVQNVNHHLPHIAELLYQLDFMPLVRLDDLMVSYAPPGGTVGPHFDSYDVFLLQVGGKKRWQISSQTNIELVEDAPLKILKRFEPEQEWILEEGDMLYLPPRFAHHGVALEPGMTYSIGFRAPTAQEMAVGFLDYLRDKIQLEGMYADPDLVATADPAAIEDTFVGRIETMLQGIRWERRDVEEFIGRYFTEPKQHVFFEAPDDLMDEADFEQAITEHGVVLDLKSQILHRQGKFYINGEPLEADVSCHTELRQLASQRRLPAGEFDPALVESLFCCYEYGYLRPDSDD